MSIHISYPIAAIITNEDTQPDLAIYGEVYVGSPLSSKVFFIEWCHCTPNKPFNLTILTRPTAPADAIINNKEF